MFSQVQPCRRLLTLVQCVLDVLCFAGVVDNMSGHIAATRHCDGTSLVPHARLDGVYIPTLTSYMASPSMHLKPLLGRAVPSPALPWPSPGLPWLVKLELMVKYIAGLLPSCPYTLLRLRLVPCCTTPACYHLLYIEGGSFHPPFSLLSGGPVVLAAILPSPQPQAKQGL